MDLVQKHAAPTLRTERLQLAPFADRHFETFAELHADPGTMKYIGDGTPLDRVGAWFHLAMLIGHWQLRGYGVWAIEDRETGVLIGRAGLLHPDGWEHAELNWMIAPAMQGRGLATEAAGAVLDYAFDQLGFEQLISFVRPGNTASANVARKLGATLGETIEFMNSPMHVYRYAREQCRSRRAE